jgi:hypothetical protein
LLKVRFLSVEIITLELRAEGLPELVVKHNLPLRDVSLSGHHHVWKELGLGISKIVQVLAPALSAILKKSCGEDWDEVLENFEAAANKQYWSPQSDEALKKAISANWPADQYLRKTYRNCKNPLGTVDYTIGKADRDPTQEYLEFPFCCTIALTIPQDDGDHTCYPLFWQWRARYRLYRQKQKPLDRPNTIDEGASSGDTSNETAIIGSPQMSDHSSIGTLSAESSLFRPETSEGRSDATSQETTASMKPPSIFKKFGKTIRKLGF